MSYSSNPLLPKARKLAVNLVLVERLPVTVAARKSGVHRSTLHRWLRRWKELQLDNRHAGLPTLSSRPHVPGRSLPAAVVRRIVELRESCGRCAAVLHALLLREGASISLSSVKRILSRLGLTKTVSKWKRYRAPVPRPKAAAPGDLLQTDTIHFVHPLTRQRLYLYTVIDVYSRWAYAEVSERISQRHSRDFILRAQTAAPFAFGTLQSDNGPEFGSWFKDMLASQGITLRHSRIRKPNDNAHVERFNRTVQDECVGRWPTPVRRARLNAWLDYYNNERLHLSLQCRTPMEVLQRF